MLRKLRIAILAVAGVAILASASPAMASTGYWPGSGYCTDNRNDGLGNRITASAPVMYALDAPGVVGGGQLVGFFTTLQRWDGRSWVASQYSILKTQTTGWGFNSEIWYDHRTGAQVSGATAFTITKLAYAYPYRLRYDYFWFDANEVVTAHTASLSYGLRDDRDRLSSLAITGRSYVDWCVY
jgi:hypothetical protein